MSCDEVREHLAEHVLGTLSGQLEADVRAHLRGCMGCRRELATLEQGVSTFARAAHQVEPPESLKARVLSVLREEQDSDSKPLQRKGFRLCQVWPRVAKSPPRWQTPPPPSPGPDYPGGPTAQQAGPHPFGGRLGGR